MRLSTLLIGALLLIPAAGAAQMDSATTAQVIQRERDMWQYVKERNFAPLRAALDSSVYTAVTQHGVHGLTLDVGRYEWTSLERYQLSDFVTKGLAPQLVLLTYKADLRGRSLGNRVAGIYWMATIWRLKEGEWQAVFHSEVKG